MCESGKFKPSNHMNEDTKVVTQIQLAAEIPTQVVNSDSETVETTAQVVNEPKKDKPWLFKKGQSGNIKGKPKGAISEKTKLWETLGNDLTTIHAQKFNEVLSEMMEHNPEKGMYIYLQVLEYFKPKLNRTTLVGDPDKPLEVKTASFE